MSTPEEREQDVAAKIADLQADFDAKKSVATTSFQIKELEQAFHRTLARLREDARQAERATLRDSAPPHNHV